MYEPPTSFLNALNNLSKVENLHLYIPDPKEEQEVLIKSRLEQGIVEYVMEKEGGNQVLGLMTKQSNVKREKVTEYYDPDEELQNEQEEALAALEE